jgi:hypothetical protein
VRERAGVRAVVEVAEDGERAAHAESSDVVRDLELHGPGLMEKVESGREIISRIFCGRGAAPKVILAVL